MTTSTTAVSSFKGQTFARRKSRTLVGWLPENEGALWVAGRQMSQAPDPAHIAVCRAAREAVSKRPAGCDQANIFAPLPDALNAHLAALQAHSKTAQILTEAGSPKIVDLRRVCAAQPTIHVEDASARVAQLSATDIASLAELTIPQHRASNISITFDPAKNAWLLSSPNPNLRVAGHFGGELQPGVTGFGFVVEVSLSYLQVVGIDGRYFLRDGYHRAYGLLEAGIYHAPALVREWATIEEANMPVGLLSATTYLGVRPPLLGDYLNHEVSAESWMPVTSKMIVVQGIELSSIA